MDRIPKNPIKFFLFVSKPHRVWIISAVLCTLIGSLLSNYTVVVLRNLSDALIAPQLDVNLVIFLGCLYPGLYLISELIWRGSGFVGMRWFTGARFTGYQTLYRYLSAHSKSYFNERFAGSLSSNITNAVDGCEMLFQRALWDFLSKFLSLFWFVVITMMSDLRLGFIIFVWSFAFLACNTFLVLKLRKYSFRASRLRSVLSGKIVDSLSNISLVHEHGFLEEEATYVEHHVDAQRRAGLQNWMYFEWVLVFNNFMIAVFIVGMVGTALYLFIHNQISLGVVVMIVAIVSNISNALFFIGSEISNSVKDYSNAQEGLDVILVPHGITDTKGASELIAKKGEIEFKNVSFGYGKNDIFTNFNLEIFPGQKVGLVGRSGAGKSTIVSLILRHFDPQKGEIRIDNQNIKEVERRTLQRAIAYVPQDTSLFHRTIFENIAYGSQNATQDEVETAAKHALAHEFILKLPKGYETLVGERGIKLSGGQRQRVAIARMFMKQAKIVIFDEATSSLDSESEQAIKVAVHNLMEGKTVIAIAHRLSTIREMDRILYIEHGKIVEDGAPDTLLAKEDGYFKRLWDHQVSGFIKEEDE